jgi:iron only hydrogenase large subunit-like protein
MPCFDKKLEASRDDFTNEDQVRDVDCVLTAAEVLDIIKDKAIDFAALEESPIDKLYVEHARTHTRTHTTHTRHTYIPHSSLVQIHKH